MTAELTALDALVGVKHVEAFAGDIALEAIRCSTAHRHRRRLMVSYDKGENRAKPDT